MTVSGWITFMAIAVFVAAISILLGATIGEYKGAIVGAVVAVVLIILLLSGMRWYYNNTAQGQRAVKTQESNFKNGLQRTVKVFDVNGNIIYQYDGKIDIEYDECRILFDDEKGKRHVIYYTTGTVLIEETDE